MKRGVDGFRLGKTQYLTEDPKLRNESPSSTPASTDEYQYLTHAYTYDRPENGKILAQWRDIVTNQTKGDCLFALRDNIGADVLAVYNEDKKLIDLPQSSLFLETADEKLTAETLFKGVSQSLAASGGWPGWDVSVVAIAAKCLENYVLFICTLIIIFSRIAQRK